MLAEALDRFSRDQEDTAGLLKRLTFAGVNIVTLAEGDITHLHVGLKGTMNALFLKDLADKTRRGLRGRVELGKSGGGLCYGYKVRRATYDGAAATGDREIVAAEAEVIRRIFRDYAGGLSPKALAKRLNAERCPGPGRAPWNPSTIHGNPARGTGILNNELYIGRLVWNRLRYLKAPDTGKRVSRPNPPPDWVTTAVPELRIVDDELMSLEARKVELQSRVNAPEMPELLHPRMADVYREVGSLCSALESEESRTSAVDAIRALIETILLEPDGERLKITLKGDLAGMLSAARDSKRSPDTGDLLVQIKLVAGACSQRYFQLWSGAA